MIVEAGHAALWLAAGFALLAGLAPRLAGGDELRVPAMLIAGLFALCALLALAYGFDTADFSLILVDDRVHRLQPPAVRFAALLNSPAGWLLATSVLTGAGAAVAAALGQSGVRHAWALFALLVATLVVDPFVRQAVIAPEGRHLWIPVDLGAAFAGPVLFALAVALLLFALLRGGWERPPRWLVLTALGGAAAAVTLGAAAVALTAEASAPFVPGGELRLQGIRARMVELRPVAGPGYTAVEARMAVDADGPQVDLAPQSRTPLYTDEAVAAPAVAHLGGGRIEARLTADNRLTLSWRPLL